MVDQIININNLTAAVRDRPVLWDKTIDIYKCRTATSDAWKEVCELLNPNFGELEEKERISYMQFVLKKWRNVRDTWLKSYRKSRDSKKSGSPGKYTRAYIYQDQMSFLYKIAELETTELSFPLVLKGDFPDHTPTASSSLDVSYPQPTERKKRVYRDTSERNNIGIPTKRVFSEKKRIIDDIESQILTTLKHMEEDRYDRHLSFYKSLVPSLRQLNDEETLAFQAGVIHLLQSLNSRRFQTTRPHPTLVFPNIHSCPQTGSETNCRTYCQCQPVTRNMHDSASCQPASPTTSDITDNSHCHDLSKPKT